MLWLLRGARMNRAWAPNYLGRWLFSQDKLWITADGRCLKVSKMQRGHVLNTLLMLERCSADLSEEGALPFGVELQATPLYTAMYARILE